MIILNWVTYIDYVHHNCDNRNHVYHNCDNHNYHYDNGNNNYNNYMIIKTINKKSEKWETVNVSEHVKIKKLDKDDDTLTLHTILRKKYMDDKKNKIKWRNWYMVRAVK